MLLNRTIKTEVGEALAETARQPIPAGLKQLAVGVRLSDDADLDQFEIRGAIGGAEFKFADAQADFETPAWPLKRASGDLTALAANSTGYIVLDVRGLSEIALFAATESFSAEAAEGSLTAAGNAVGYAPEEPAMAAANALAAAVPEPSDTVTIGADANERIYTFVSALTGEAGEPGEVLLGDNAGEARANLAAAINGDPNGEGMTYGEGTGAHPLVTAEVVSTDVIVTAITAGSAGNSIPTTASLDSGDWNEATLVGGADLVPEVQGDTVTIGGVTYRFTDPLVDEPYNVLVGNDAEASLDNLIDAINGEDGGGEEGTVYGAGTEAHPLVSAAAGDGDTMDVTAAEGGKAGNEIQTLASSASLSWGGGTLTGGKGPTTVEVSLYG